MRVDCDLLLNIVSGNIISLIDILVAPQLVVVVGTYTSDKVLFLLQVLSLLSGLVSFASVSALGVAAENPFLISIYFLFQIYDSEHV